MLLCKLSLPEDYRGFVFLSFLNGSHLDAAAMDTGTKQVDGHTWHFCPKEHSDSKLWLLQTQKDTVETE